MKFVFIVTADDRAEIARVRRFAEEPGRTFRAGDPPPGEPYQCILGVAPLLCTKATYTISIGHNDYTGESLELRHLTMRWENRGQRCLVPWAVVEEMAQLFGFTGGKAEWQLEPFPHDDMALVILQPFKRG